MYKRKKKWWDNERFVTNAEINQTVATDKIQLKSWLKYHYLG